MKNLYLVLVFVLFSSVFAFGQDTYVPDNNFEAALCDLGYDDINCNSWGGILNNYVPTANIVGVTSLNVGSEYIHNLTGIQDFDALEILDCSYNNLSNLPVYSNPNLEELSCTNNQLTYFNPGTNPNLTYLNLHHNNLTNINLLGVTALETLYCYNNELTSLNVSANTNFYSPIVDIEADRIWLDMTNSDGIFSQILLGFFEEATLEHDQNYDAKRLFSGNNFDFSSILDETDYAIQGLPTFNESQTIPLSVRAPITGLLRISIHDVEGVFHTQNVYIYDYETETLHNLKESAYEFNIAESGNYTERFELRFTDDTTGITDTVLTSLAVYPNPSDNRFNISWNGEVAIHISVTDISGKLILENTEIESVNKPYALDMSDYRSGVYFMRITVNGNETVKKLVLR